MGYVFGKWRVKINTTKIMTPGKLWPSHSDCLSTDCLRFHNNQDIPIYFTEKIFLLLKYEAAPLFYRRLILFTNDILYWASKVNFSSIDIYLYVFFTCVLMNCVIRNIKSLCQNCPLQLWNRPYYQHLKCESRFHEVQGVSYPQNLTCPCTIHHTDKGWPIALNGSQ